MLQQFQLPISDPDADVATTNTGARANRACEVCRRMKIKCDRIYPCKHCQQTFNDCVYSQPQRKKRKSAQADRIEHLEKRLKAVEESCQQRALPTTALTRLSSIGPMDVTASNEETPNSSSTWSNATRQRSNVRTSPALGNQGEARFLHSAAHMDFVRRLKDELGNWPGADAENRVRARNVAAPKLFQPANSQQQPVLLPSQNRAQHLVNLALDAHFLHSFIHRPTFDSIFALLFTLDIKEYSAEEYNYLPLLLSLMAVGCLFEVEDEESRDGYISEGTQYFEACRGLVDLQDCSDLVTLQTILYMNIFLLYTARMSSCFSALSYTFSLALRMKYHQATDTDSVTTREDKKRVFWTTRHLLACVSITGGLPMPIGGDDLDLEYPSVDHNEMHPRESLSTSPSCADRWNPTVASVACFHLHNIIGHVTKRLYPAKGVKNGRGQGPLRHLVSIETVRELQGELRSWLASLPSGYRLGQQNHPPHIERAKYELCMSYAHAQIYLYRPFLHYLATSPADGTGAEEGFPAYASACVDASRNIIRLAQDMYHRGLLRGVQWDISNIILASSLTMLYIILAKKGSAVEEMALVELSTARDMMRLLEPYTALSKRTSVAVRLLTTTILPNGQNHTFPLNAIPRPPLQVSSQADNSYTASLAQKTYGLTSKTTSEPGGQDVEAVERQNGLAPFPEQIEDQLTNSNSLGPPQSLQREEITSKGPSTFTRTRALEPSITSYNMPSDQGMSNAPFGSGDITRNQSLSSTFTQDFGMNADYYGYMVDATGPIDFSDMIGDLFTSEGVL